MPAIVLYLIKLSCSLGVLWLFYRLVLRNLTFYTWNRWYLLGYTLLSFLIPLVNIGPIRGEDPTLQPVILQYIPVIDKPLPYAAPSVASGHATHWDTWNILLLVLAIGSCFLLVRFLLRCYSLRNLRRRAVLLLEGPVSIYRIAESVSPFSFGNAIYVNTYQHGEKEWEEIVLHEYVHIRQRHTLDILFGELLVILNWYNPFAWLIRFSIRQNLEFIADQAVIDNGFDKKGYQYHLLKVVGQARYKLANNFNFSSLKKRIIMMNKMKSARVHLLRFLFILPLLTVLLVAFRNRFEQHYINVAGIAISLPNKAPMSGVIVREKYTGIHATTDANGYYKLKIPAAGDSAAIHLDFTKPGFEPNYVDRSWRSLPKTTGLCWIAAMPSREAGTHDIFVIAPDLTRSASADPDYADAFHALQQVLRENNQMNDYKAIEKAHPEISLWYITEDKEKRLLIHTDGTIERYGFPGSPSLADMDSKYGTLPDFMVKNVHPVNIGYLSRWADISARAGKEFHTTTPGVRAIIFPGDSRVIAVDAAGAARVYDMDSDDPKERPAFEALYGPLPACVPVPYHFSEPTVHSRPAPQIQAADTVPRKPDTTHNAKITAGWTNPDFYKALWIIDGVAKPQGWYSPDSLNAQNIASMTIYSGDKAAQYFGEKGASGVVAVITKENDKLSRTPGKEKNIGDPLIVIDGVLFEGADLKSIDPNSIQSITILKGQNAIQIFGDKGRNGAILVTSKKLPHPPIVNSLPDTTRPQPAAGKFFSQMGLRPLGPQPMYIVDGIVVGSNVVQNLDRADISSISVLQQKAAKAIYGDKAANGVILITTRKQTPLPPQN